MRKSTFTGFCAPAATVGSSSESEQQVRILELIKANRAPYDKFRPLATDEFAKVAEKKKRHRAALLKHFEEYGRKDGDKPWCWDDAYIIRRSDGKPLKVCKRLWFAIIGHRVGRPGLVVHF